MAQCKIKKIHLKEDCIYRFAVIYGSKPRISNVEYSYFNRFAMLQWFEVQIPLVYTATAMKKLEESNLEYHLPLLLLQWFYSV